MPIWRFFVFAFLGMLSLAFSAKSYADEDLTCSIRLASGLDGSPIGLNRWQPNSTTVQNGNATYVKCIRAPKHAWKRSGPSRPDSSYMHAAFGPVYDNLQDALDLTVDEVSQSYGVGLDGSNSGCVNCRPLTQANWDVLFANSACGLAYSSGFDANATACKPTVYQTSTGLSYSPPSESDSLVVANVSVVNATPIAIPPDVFGHTTGYKAVPASYWSGRTQVQDSVIRVPVCPPGWLPAMADDGQRTFLGCYLSLKAARAMGVSGLDSTSEGCGFGCNPVNLATGDKIDYKEDYRNHSPFPIVWDRYYHSASGSWTFTYERSVRMWEDTLNNVQRLSMARPDGGTLLFKHSGANSDPWVVDMPATKGVLGRLSNTMDTGSVVGFQYRNLEDQIEYYDLTGKFIRLENQAGFAIAMEYDNNGKLSEIHDQFGRQLTITRSSPTEFGVSWIASVSDGTHTVSYEQSPATGPGAFNLRVLLHKVIYPDTTRIEYLYDEGGLAGKGLLTGIVDQEGLRYATYSYDTSDRVKTSLHDPEGAAMDAVQYEFDSPDNPNHSTTKITWATGSAYADASPISQGIAKVAGFTSTCPVCFGGNRSSISYDAAGNPIASENFLGIRDTASYDQGRGLVETQTQAVGTAQERTRQIAWHPNWRIPAQLVEPIVVAGVSQSRTTNFNYNSRGLLTQRSVSADGNTRTWAYAYTADGLLATETAPGNRITSYAYAASTDRNLLTITNAKGQLTTFGNHTPTGLPGTIVDPNGLTTKMTYDAMDRVVKIERGSATTHWETTQLHYNAKGDLDRIDHPNGDWVSYTYNTARRLTRIQSPTGARDFYLDSQGRPALTAITDNDNNFMWWRFITYDMAGRVIKTTGSQSNVEYEYDNEGQLLQAEDKVNPSSTHRAYDALGRLRTMLDQSTKAYGLSYDPSDNPVSATDARGNTTTYAYNGFGDQVGLVSPDAGARAMVVNANGETISATDARGAATTITRDALGRATQIVYSDTGVAPGTVGFKPGIETQTFIYDSCPLGIGRLCSMADASGTTTYGYDLWGRVVKKAFKPLGQNFTLTVQYGYTTGGDLATITYPTGRVLTIANDKGDPVSLNYDGHSILSGATYRPFHGRSKGWEWGEGLGSLAYTYNPENQLASITGDVQKSLFYLGVGKLLGVSDGLDPSKDAFYSYTPTGALQTAMLANRPEDVHYAYDDNTNRSSSWMGEDPSNTDSLATFATQASSNRLSSITTPFTTTTWQYDATGNLVSEQGTTYLYDAKNRMVEALVGGSPVSFAYNALGERMRKTRVMATNAQHTHDHKHKVKTSGPQVETDYFVHDQEGRLLGVYDENGDPLEEFVWFDGWRPVASVRGATSYEIYRITSDQLGTPLTVRNAAGVKVWEWDVKEPFGYQLPSSDPDGDGVNFYLNLRFPGQWLDTETGLYHNGFRDYHPRAGRYIQSDPIGLEGGWNTYSYVSANPLAMVDFYGLDGLWIEQGIVDERGGSAHMSVGVGTMASNRTFSFGTENSILWGPTPGYVYEDDAKNGRIVEYYDVSSQVAAEIVAYFAILADSENKGKDPWTMPYNIISGFLGEYGMNCRTFSRKSMDYFVGRYGLKRSSIPKRFMAPANGNVFYRAVDGLNSDRARK